MERNGYLCTMNLLEHWGDDMRLGLYLCIKGECDMVVNDRSCHLTCGDAFVKSPLVQIGELESSEDLEFATILEDEIEVFAPIAEDNFDVIQELLRQNKFHYSANREEQDFLLNQRRLIDERKREQATVPFASRQYKLIGHIVALMEQATILEFARMYVCHQSLSREEPEKERHVMVRFFFLLFLHYKHHRQVQFYADALSFSPNHFTRIIKKVSNRTPSEWIALVTINHAKKILRQNTVSIKEVAQALNFPEQFTFRKYFKLYTGLSPKEYRMKHAVG